MISFDIMFQKITERKCKLIGVDMAEQRLDTISKFIEIGGDIVKTTLANFSDQNHTTFTDLVKRFGHQKINFLKMDIESIEFDLLDQLFDFRICQMMVEVHGSRDRFYQFLHIAALAGFHLVHHEVNGGTLKACELTMVHESCFDDFDISIKLGRYLD
ncbi:hypothetical protein FO519_007389 [Halicephalobus sp. NKZ332]|nr:hypothetical protein FO519_007389 [Halicephalobus sp. NKZ332]